MKLWLTIITTFIIQELVMMNTSLLRAYQADYNVIVLTLIFIAASIFDVSVGYALGLWFRKRFSKVTVVRYLEKRVQELEQILGERGYRFAFIFLGFVNFNYVNAFFASWTNVRFKTVALYLVLGDILWYLVASIMIVGVSTYVDPIYAMYVVIGISIIFVGLSFLFRKKIFKKTKIA